MFQMLPVCLWQHLSSSPVQDVSVFQLNPMVPPAWRDPKINLLASNQKFFWGSFRGNVPRLLNVLTWGLCASRTSTLQAAAQVGPLVDGQQPEGGGLEADPEGRPDERGLPEQRPGDVAGERARFCRWVFQGPAGWPSGWTPASVMNSKRVHQPWCSSRPAALTRSPRRPGNTPSSTSSAPPRWGNSRSSSSTSGTSRVAFFSFLFFKLFISQSFSSFSRDKYRSLNTHSGSGGKQYIQKTNDPICKPYTYTKTHNMVTHWPNKQPISAIVPHPDLVGVGLNRSFARGHVVVLLYWQTYLW